MDRIKFKCFDKKILSKYPIEKVKIIDFNWIKNMMEHLKKHKNWRAHTGRCPGIISVVRLGWIHKAYQNFTIETNGDMNTFRWETDIDQAKTSYGKIIGDYVNFHETEQLADFKLMPLHTLNTLIKINSPWYVNIPKGYRLLCMPVPYPCNNAFTAAFGILDQDNVLNVPLYWHVPNGKVLVKKGTPLCQYVLLKDHDCVHVNEMISKKEIEKVKQSKAHILNKQDGRKGLNV